MTDKINTICPVVGGAMKDLSGLGQNLSSHDKPIRTLSTLVMIDHITYFFASVDGSLQ